jgi:hypothetical protein
MIIAQNMPPGDGCVFIGIFMLAVLVIGAMYGAYQYGYSRGRKSGEDEKIRGFAILPPRDTDSNNPI